MLQKSEIFGEELDQLYCLLTVFVFLLFLYSGRRGMWWLETHMRYEISQAFGVSY